MKEIFFGGAEGLNLGLKLFSKLRYKPIHCSSGLVVPFTDNRHNRFSIIPIKMPARGHIDEYKIMLKGIWKGRGEGIAQTILNKKNQVGRISLANFKTWHVAQ